MSSDHIKIENYEEFVKWFESVYKGRPVEIDLYNQDETYRCTIVYFKEQDLT